MTTAQLSEITTPHGATLAVRDWPLPAAVLPRALVLIVHGLGEHSGRYAHVAQQLNSSIDAAVAYESLNFAHIQRLGLAGDPQTLHRPDK